MKVYTIIIFWIYEVNHVKKKVNFYFWQVRLEKFELCGCFLNLMGFLEEMVVLALFNVEYLTKFIKIFNILICK